MNFIHEMHESSLFRASLIIVNIVSIARPSSKSLKEEKVRLLKLESVLSKRRAELVTTESNAQKIKEQLEAVLKILNHNQLQVAELDKKVGNHWKPTLLILHLL